LPDEWHIHPDIPDQGHIHQVGAVAASVAKGIIYLKAGVMRPGVMRPGVMRPGVMRPGVMRPGVMRPGVMRPGATRHAVRNTAGSRLRAPLSTRQWASTRLGCSGSTPGRREDLASLGQVGVRVVTSAGLGRELGRPGP
jgi:hypothetical protein